MHKHLMLGTRIPKVKLACPDDGKVQIVDAPALFARRRSIVLGRYLMTVGDSVITRQRSAAGAVLMASPPAPKPQEKLTFRLKMFGGDPSATRGMATTG